MRGSKPWIIGSTSLVIVGLILWSAPEGRGRTPSPRRTDPCDDVAQAILDAAQLEAQADYMLAIANCINECGGCAPCEDEAADELQAALDLAQEQYQARLDVCAALGGGAYDPAIVPADFSTKIDSAYFPLKGGSRYVYETVTEDGLETDTVLVLKDKDFVSLDGVLCRAVHDTVDVDGEVIEDTIDWYAQHDDGTVWYFGELSKSFDDEGFLDNLDGSWRAGVNHAKPGIIMEADPAVGDFYRQEFLVNEAEDVARVVSLSETVTVPYGTFHDCLQTEESTPTEPGHVEWKYYAKGVGLILVVDPDTGERTELVKISG